MNEWIHECRWCVQIINIYATRIQLITKILQRLKNCDKGRAFDSVDSSIPMDKEHGMKIPQVFISNSVITTR